MTGAMFAAISGMRSHMEKLNAIGNNVANVNTYGYKAGTVTFSEALYTTKTAGANGTPLGGGTNPVQIGYGCNVSTIDLDMSTKNFVPTGKGTDCMIAGDGFFMVGTKAGITDPKDLQLTRVGQFKFDESGYLVDGSGMIVYGFLTASQANGNGMPDYTNAGNTNQTKGVSTDLTPIRLPLAADGTVGTLAAGSPLYPYVDNGQTLDSTTAVAKDADGNPKRVSCSGISIDKTGKIIGTVSKGDGTSTTIEIGYVPIASVDNPAGVTHMGGPYYQALGGAGNVTVASVGGTIQGNLGNLDDAAALAAGGKTILSSGETELAPGGLESSGTDVATEFSEMITTQRGYQANTRIITVTDAMLEELVNIKR